MWLRRTLPALGVAVMLLSGIAMREVRGVDGKVSLVTIPTYPQYPYSQLVERDGKLFHDTGEVDKDDRPILVELTYPDRPKQDRK